MSDQLNLGDIIQFVISNFGILIFIGAALFGGVFKQLVTQQRETKHRPSMPPFGSGPLFGDDEDEDEPPVRPRAEQPQRPLEDSAPAVMLTEQRETVIQQPQGRPSLADTFPFSPVEEPPEEPETVPITAALQKQNPIVQGILWSEILSPPRAKRQYRK